MSLEQHPRHLLSFSQRTIFRPPFEIPVAARRSHEDSYEVHQERVRISQEGAEKTNENIRGIVWGELSGETINGQTIVNAMKQKPLLKFLFEMPHGGAVWEGITLEEHALMYSEQSKKYIRRPEWNSSLLSFEEFNLLPTLHDLGKPLSVDFIGLTKDQHTYNKPLMDGVLQILGVEKQKRELLCSIASQDHLQPFISQNTSIPLEQIAHNIYDDAQKLGVDAKDYAELTRIHQLLDSSCYTKDAPGGRYSHDKAFTLGSVNENGMPIIDYSAILQKRWKELVSLLPVKYPHQAN